MVASIALFLPNKPMPFFVITPGKLLALEVRNPGRKLMAAKIVIRVT